MTRVLHEKSYVRDRYRGRAQPPRTPVAAFSCVVTRGILPQAIDVGHEHG
jgi:hypothetical protein